MSLLSNVSEAGIEKGRSMYERGALKEGFPELYGDLNFAKVVMLKLL